MQTENMAPPVSNAEIKRMKVREHNRAYEAGELNKQTDLRKIVRDVVGHAKQSLNL